MGADGEPRSGARGGMGLWALAALTLAALFVIGAFEGRAGRLGALLMLPTVVVLGWVAWRIARSAFLPGAGDAADDVSPRFQSFATSAGKTASDIDTAIRQAPRGVQQVLEELRPQVEQFVHRTEGLARRATTLERHLSATTDETLQRQIEELRSKAHSAQDRFAKEQYESARRQKEEQREARARLTATLDGIEAQLTNLQASLEGIETRVVQLSAYGTRQVTERCEEVARDLGVLIEELDRFERGLDDEETWSA